MRHKASKAEKFLFDLPSFAHVGEKAYRPGLNRIDQILARMDRPERAFRCIHVAGTNGKGSTASMIASISHAAGIKTGLHTTPHLIHVGERMRIDGVPAPPDWLDKAVARHGDMFIEAGASFFEVTTAMSFLWFAEQGVSLAVVEVGLGGRFDATNILRPEVSIITNVSYDHEQVLGETLAEIAGEKAGIIKHGVPVVTAAQDPDVLGIISDAAKAAEAPFHNIDDEVVIKTGKDTRISIQTPEHSYADISMDLPGFHQFRNAATAVRALELVPNLLQTGSYPFSVGLEQTRALSGIRGRLEVIRRQPLIIVDVAHNTAALIASVEAAISISGGIERLFLGLMKDKNVAAFASWLAQNEIPVSVLHIDSDRAYEPVELATSLRAAGVSIERHGQTVSEALHAITGDVSNNKATLLLGSHLLVADALAWEVSSRKASSRQAK